MDWRIYYGDGTTFTSEEGTPSDAPALDVQAIVTRTNADRRNVVSVHGWDYYWRLDGEWWGGDLFGLFDALLRKAHPVLFGRTIDTNRHGEIIAQAVKDKLTDGQD